MPGRSYMHQLDAKNRMRMPAKLRAELGDNYVISLGTGGCLYVYTAEQYAKVEKFLSKVNPFREKSLEVARGILYNSWTAEEDKQGRILIPSHIREVANIKKNVMVFQGPVYIELWAQEVWDSKYKEFDFESIADAFEAFDED